MNCISHGSNPRSIAWKITLLNCVPMGRHGWNPLLFAPKNMTGFIFALNASSVSSGNTYLLISRPVNTGGEERNYYSQEKRLFFSLRQSWWCCIIFFLRCLLWVSRKHQRWEFRKPIELIPRPTPKLIQWRRVKTTHNNNSRGGTCNYYIPCLLLL